jgi:hypothetical protein
MVTAGGGRVKTAIGGVIFCVLVAAAIPLAFGAGVWWVLRWRR